MISTCPNCKGVYFELKETSPRASAYKFYFIQCSTCGNPVGVTDYYHTNTKIDNLEKEIKSLKQSSINLESRLSNIERLLTHIARK